MFRHLFLAKVAKSTTPITTKVWYDERLLGGLHLIQKCVVRERQNHGRESDEYHAHPDVHNDPEQIVARLARPETSVKVKLRFASIARLLD